MPLTPLIFTYRILLITLPLTEDSGFLALAMSLFIEFSVRFILDEAFLPGPVLLLDFLLYGVLEPEGVLVSIFSVKKVGYAFMLF